MAIFSGITLYVKSGKKWWAYFKLVYLKRWNNVDWKQVNLIYWTLLFIKSADPGLGKPSSSVASLPTQHNLSYFYAPDSPILRWTNSLCGSTNYTPADSPRPHTPSNPSTLPFYLDLQLKLHSPCSSCHQQMTVHAASSLHPHDLKQAVWTWTGYG